MNNRKQLGILIIIIGLILIGLIVYFGFIREEEQPGVTPPVVLPGGQLPAGPVSGTSTPSDAPRDRAVYDISEEPEHQFNSADLAKRAMLYTERLGSYSSQSDYSNFSDLKIYMTGAMKDWVDGEVASLKAKNQGSAYYGIETRALTTRVDSFDEGAGTAAVTIETERRESRDTVGGGEAFRQSIQLRFVKAAEEWLIDGAYWK